MVESLPTIVEKAQVLNLLDPGVARGALGYTPDGEEQVRSRTADGLWKKLTPKGKDNLKKKVEEGLQMLKEAYGQDEEPDMEKGNQESDGTGEGSENNNGEEGNAQGADLLPAQVGGTEGEQQSNTTDS
jgi:hypothetical protein